MPTYEYQCETCGHRFEVFQSMNDAKLTDCQQPECAGNVKRLLGTGAGLIFKGAGFYQTDYRSQSYQAGVKSDSAPASGDSAPSSPSSPGESKPAAKKPEPAAAPKPKPQAQG